MGISSENEYIFCFDAGKVIYESAAKAFGYSNGEYYYYGPYEGTYTIDETGLHAEVRNNWQFAFNIIDAIEIFEGLDNYADSSSLLKRCHLNYALELYEAGDFTNARNHFQLAEQTEIVKKHLRASAWELLRSYIEENGPISKKDESAELIDSKTTAENYTLAIRQGKLTIQAEKTEKSNRKEYGFYLRIEEDISTVFSYDVGTETMKLESKFQHHMENNVGVKDSYTTKEGSAIWNICDFVEEGDAKAFIQDVEGELFYSSLYAQQIGTVVFLQEELPKTNLGITVKDLGFTSF